ncbi:DUF3828 domain-containing protein [bacterium]|nr:DUF3828 domain-containing protein [bacterium]
MNSGIKLHTFSLFTVLLILLSGILIYTQTGCTSSKVTPSPEATVEAFYRWYIHSLNQNYDPLKKGKVTLKKYVTVRLINEIEKQFEKPNGLAADYFLQAQDWLDEWEGNISVKKAVIKGSAATTIVTLGAQDEGKHKLSVSLTQELGTWKIGEVEQLR